MYCSSCGAAVARGLTYCNQCGAKLKGATGAAAETSEAFPESLVWAIVTVFIVGIGSTIGLMAVMKQSLDFSQELIIAFALMMFLLMFVIEGVLIRLLLLHMSRAKATSETERLAEQQTEELKPSPARVLADPGVSVTEHTTRNFESVPVYEDRH